MTQRSNEEWIAALDEPGAARQAALDDLRRILVRGLRYALASRGSVTDADLEDFAQDALLKILDALDSFRGESRFTTWAQKIAVRVAFSALRHRHWRDVPFPGTMDDDQHSDFVPDSLIDPLASPETQALQGSALDLLRRVLAEELTDRQRQALVAVVLQGMPLAEVALRMGTNRNALYKLVHDARQRLKRRMAAAGMPAEEMLAAFA